MVPILLGEIDNNLIPVAAIVGGSVVGVVAISLGMLTSIARTRALERSRRELAAYVAEGSMTPEEAERLLEAGPKPPGCGNT